MRHALWIVPALLAVAGCAPVPQTYWTRADGSPAAFATASSYCEAQAETRAPPMSLGMKGYFPNNQTWCSPTAGGTSCVPINPGYLPQARSDADTNAGAREVLYESCMVSAGWHMAGSEPIAPVPVLPEAAVGQALTFCDKIFRGKRSAEFDRCVMTRARELNGTH